MRRELRYILAQENLKMDAILCAKKPKKNEVRKKYEKLLL
jgi:hypothetical protein